MLKVLLHIFRRKHITNADLKRAIENARSTQATQPKIIEYQEPRYTCPKCGEHSVFIAQQPTCPNDNSIYYCPICEQMYTKEEITWRS